MISGSKASKSKISGLNLAGSRSPIRLSSKRDKVGTNSNIKNGRGRRSSARQGGHNSSSVSKNHAKDDHHHNHHKRLSTNGAGGGNMRGIKKWLSMVWCN